MSMTVSEKRREGALRRGRRAWSTPVQPRPYGIRDRVQEVGMRFELLGRRSVGPRLPHFDRDPRWMRLDELDVDRLCDDLVEPKADLAAAGELHIALGEELRVNQRAVLDPEAAVDAEAGAKGIEAVLGSRMPGAGELQRID